MAVIELTQANFESVVTENDVVIVDFWAPWCGPCRGFAPIYEDVAEAHAERKTGVVFAKVNTEDQQELGAYFQIRSIPTLMVFRERVILFSQAGALPKSALEEVVEKCLEVDMVKVHAEIAAQEKSA
jgi:thioredoxin 1